MKRRPVEWLPRDDEDEEPRVKSMTFRVVGQWVAVDQDQLLLPIAVEDKTDVEIEDDGYTAILKQYGGESLLNDMLMADQELDRGTRWRLWRDETRLTIEPTETTDDD